jgi:hypothetical protein
MTGIENSFAEMFGVSTREALLKHNIARETAEFVVACLKNTFVETKNDLNVDIPIRLRSLNILQAEDRAIVKQSGENSFNMAFFIPVFDNNKLVRGELVINDGSLVTYSKSIERRSGNKSSTPWKLIGDLAHEMKHAKQCEDNPDRVREDMEKNPYDSIVIELEAIDYAHNFLKKKKPKDFLDRIGKAFEMIYLDNDSRRHRRHLDQILTSTRVMLE